MDLGLAGRVYVVTGGTRGLGRATAEALVSEGARVVLSGRDAERAKQAADETGGPGAALGLQADLADPGSAGRLVAAAVARFGRLDGALLSVGGPPAGATLEVGDEQWRESFDAIVLGALRAARAVVGALPEEGGSLAFVLSSSVREPLADLAISNGLRPGLAVLAKSLSRELGPRGVRVNGLLPARISTERLASLDAGRRKAELNQLRAEVALGRDGTPEEFGRVAAFVLSPAASFLTGVMLPVDGGLLHGV